jgi:outer membrane protein assembly factor BamB
MAERNDFHYDAFISYRHNEFDSFVAENLHKKLESFKLPKSVLPKVQNGKKKIERVFRDVEELPLTDNLSDPISKALLNSDYLITICTPRYPESRWCMKEIEVFLQTHPRDHILVVLAEDEPVNSFPEILCYEDVKTTTENGETVITRRELEPLAADTRGENKKEVLKAMDIAVIKLCAAMFGLNYDDLKQRHREQRIRRLATIFGSIGAAVLAFAIFATVMLIKIGVQNVTINRQYQELQDSFATTMASASGNLFEAGRKKDAVYAVRNVIPDDSEAEANANAVKALYEGMGIYKISNTYSPACAFDTDSMLGELSISGDGRYVLATDETTAYVYDAETGQVLHSIKSPNGYIRAVFCGSDGLVWNNDDNSYYYSFSDKKDTPLELPARAMLSSSDDGMLILADDYEVKKLYFLKDKGNIAFSFDYSTGFETPYIICTDYIFGEKEITLCFSDLERTNYIVVLDASDGKVLDKYQLDEGAEPSIHLENGILYAAYKQDPDDWQYIDVIALDTRSKNTLWKTTLEDFDLPYGFIFVSDSRLFLSSKNEMAVLDVKNGEVIKRFFDYNTDPLIEGWISDNELFYISSSGKIFECDDYDQTDKTDAFFTKAPDHQISAAKYLGDSLCCVFARENYAVRYSNEMSPLAEKFEEEFETVYPDYADPEEVFADPEKYDVNRRLVENVCFSDDHKYLMVILNNKTIRIYDAENGGAAICSFETTAEVFDYFRHSNLVGGYIISGDTSYIFDEDMRLLFETERIVREDGNDLIFTDFSGLYRIPYLDVEGLCKKTDEYLGDYEPPVFIKQRYGLN